MLRHKLAIAAVVLMAAVTGGATPVGAAPSGTDLSVWGWGLDGFRGKPQRVEVQVTDNSVDSATGVVLTVDLPSAFTVQSVPSSCTTTATATSNTVVCREAWLWNSQTYAMTVVPTQTGDFTYRTSVTADQRDPNRANNSGVFGGSVVEPLPADLAVDVTASSATVSGTQMRYAIQVRNHGPNRATAVLVHEVTSESGTVRDGGATASRGTCATPSSYVPDYEVLPHGIRWTCQLGVMNPGDTALVVISPSVSGGKTLEPATLASVSVAFGLTTDDPTPENAVRTTSASVHNATVTVPDTGPLTDRVPTKDELLALYRAVVDKVCGKLCF